MKLALTLFITYLLTSLLNNKHVILYACECAHAHVYLSTVFPSLMQKKEVSTPVYGKRVEHLKSVIKACGMRLFSFLASVFMIPGSC